MRKCRDGQESYPSLGMHEVLRFLVPVSAYNGAYKILASHPECFCPCSHGFVGCSYHLLTSRGVQQSQLRHDVQEMAPATI